MDAYSLTFRTFYIILMINNTTNQYVVVHKKSLRNFH